MRVKRVYVRFYKSFNFDYLRKTHPEAVPQPWEQTPEGYWYPYVRVDLEQGITTVVGANESGKSQLLSAIRLALTGEGIEPADFCRYSQFFAVDRAMLRPDFGLEFDSITDTDRAAIGSACQLDAVPAFNAFSLFRLGEGKRLIYLKASDGWSSHDVTNIDELTSHLPVPFDIDSKIPLPDSVPIQFLHTGADQLDRTRAQRRRILDFVRDHADLFQSQQMMQSQAQAIIDAFQHQPLIDDAAARQLRLADDLLVKIAGINREVFSELERALSSGNEGYANGIVKKINDVLAKAMNFPKWWSQDSEFELLVSLRDMDLALTIRDRTGTDYSFSERSHGLKYFLSYLVQYLAHTPPRNGAPEVLLMDEPDAYLSSQGQQDLLRIFEAFATPATDRSLCQVVYVTHSPFLIDKNHAERIRVLEKGEGDEGCRVVRSVARNHYEPLRSAFGSFVGETTFISNCNLMLEGLSDQILLAGMSARLREIGAPKTENLDLNTITLVPTGSASHIPYMVYLARGRDVEHPAVIVLLDSDKSGDAAKSDLQSGGPRGKQLLDEAFVCQVGSLPSDNLRIDNTNGLKEIEDLIPLEVALVAITAYVAEYGGTDDLEKASSLQASEIAFGPDQSIHGAVEAALASSLGRPFHVDKVGFARAVIAVITREPEAGEVSEEGRIGLEYNFRALFRVLSRMERNAVRLLASERASSRIKRALRSFRIDHEKSASREDASLLLEEISSSLDFSILAEELRLELRKMAKEFFLEENIVSDVPEYEKFVERIESLVYQERRISQEG